MSSSTATPMRIGPYELVARLGEGGMAETFVAVRRGPGAFAQRVCLKRLRRELESDPELVRQFMAEAAIAARLRHAAIAQVLDFGQDGAHYYLALELVEGCDLRELLQAAGGALPSPLVLYVATELATALEFAHRGGGAPGGPAVVHRDVSPSNTLISGEGEVKLADFGIARALGEPKYTRTGIVKGKVPYMAPEYARSARLDPRSDLFSLGVLLYECACGVRPHDGATDLETLERASRGARMRLAERVPGLPPELAEIIECLLEPDPELRYQSAAVLLQALLAMPSHARARLELGALVAQALRDRSAEREAHAAFAALPTEIMDEPAGGQPARALPAAASAENRKTSHRPRPSRGARVALAVAGLCASAVMGLAALRATVEPERPQAASAADPLPEPPDTAPLLTRPEPGIAAAGAATAHTPGSGARAEPEAAGAAAWLEVVVVPFGDVSIDGERIGKAPVTVELAPGEHTIEATSRGNTVKRRVTLAPGQRRQVVLR